MTGKRPTRVRAAAMQGRRPSLRQELLEIAEMQRASAQLLLTLALRLPARQSRVRP
jgi:hypothetical protein